MHLENKIIYQKHISYFSQRKKTITTRWDSPHNYHLINDFLRRSILSSMTKYPWRYDIDKWESARKRSISPRMNDIATYLRM